MDQQAPVAA